MGNRAVITTIEGGDYPEYNIGMYLHWNGGRDVVNALLTYCKMRGYRSPEQDNYGWAALSGVVYDVFGCSGMSCGIDLVSRLDCDNYDNGMYIIEDWEIVGRKYNHGYEEEGEYSLEELLCAIDESIPKGKRMGEANILRWLEETKGREK